MSRIENPYKTARIVITGMGAVSPIGIGVENMWQNYLAGRSGIVNAQYPPSHARVAAPVSDFNVQDVAEIFHLGLSKLKKLSRGTLFGLRASYEALTQARIDPREINSERFGVVVGTAIGGADGICETARITDKGILPDPQMILKILAERPAVVASQKYKARGPVFAITGACASGNLCQSAAAEQIFLNEADIMLAIGVEAALIQELLGVFEPTGTITMEADRTIASRPLDVDRSGFVCGEGCGVLVFETLESAMRRGVEPLAELVGHKNTADAAGDTNPSGEGSRRAMLGALGRIDEGLLRKQLAYYWNLHGTGTPIGDPIEVTEVSRVADHYNSKAEVYANSTKEMVGHMFGGAGTCEGIVTIKTLQTRTIVPHRNVRHLIPEADRLTVPLLNPIFAKNLYYGVNDSLGFGGINSVIVYRRW